MKSKAHFINELCRLKNINPACDEAQSFQNLKIVELLVEINKINIERKVLAAEARIADDDNDNDNDNDNDVSRYAGSQF